MLAKAKRISASTFSKIPSKATKDTDEFFFYRYKTNGKNDLPKITILSPKKISKLATRRNKTKRVISEAIHTLYPKIKHGVLLSITARKTLEKNTPAMVLPLLQSALTKLQILK